MLTWLHAFSCISSAVVPYLSEAATWGGAALIEAVTESDLPVIGARACRGVPYRPATADSTSLADVSLRRELRCEKGLTWWCSLMVLAAGAGTASCGAAPLRRGPLGRERPLVAAFT
jgi:hypothetical protein